MALLEMNCWHASTLTKWSHFGIMAAFARALHTGVQANAREFAGADALLPLPIVARMPKLHG